jgi:hypothetical protein
MIDPFIFGMDVQFPVVANIFSSFFIYSSQINFPEVQGPVYTW